MSGKYKQVAYYPGCALEGTGHAYNRSTKELGKALGLDIVELKNWKCCGAMEAICRRYRLSYFTVSMIAFMPPDGVCAAT
jgi:heterodisulfide reductase subunit B